MPKPLRPRCRWRVLAIAATTAATLLVAAWAVSLRWTVLQTRDSAGGTTSVSGIQQGCLISHWVTNGPGWRKPWTNWFERTGEVLWVPNWNFRPDGAGGVLLPLWIPTFACTLAAAGLWRIDTLHRRRRRGNLCPACTYNRIGLPATTPCPECGNAPPAPPASVTR